jgi:hypothetical protein
VVHLTVAVQTFPSGFLVVEITVPLALICHTGDATGPFAYPYPVYVNVVAQFTITLVGPFICGPCANAAKGNNARRNRRRGLKFIIWTLMI